MLCVGHIIAMEEMPHHIPFRDNMYEIPRSQLNPTYLACGKTEKIAGCDAIGGELSSGVAKTSG